MSCPSDDLLGQTHHMQRRSVLQQRGAFKTTELGTFATAMIGAMGEYDTARHDGVSRDDACLGLAAVLRDAWPFTVTKFPPACEDCLDTGWREWLCWEQQRCERRKRPCAIRGSAFEHLYVAPCDCLAGDRLRAKVKSQEDAIAAVGRVQKRKPRGFSRLGT